MEDWVKAMEASDDGMCKGWRDQIDTLIIFVGPFYMNSYSVELNSHLRLACSQQQSRRLQLNPINGSTKHQPTHWLDFNSELY